MSEYEIFPEVEETEDHASILDQIGKNDNCDIVSDLQPFKPIGKLYCEICGREITVKKRRQNHQRFCGIKCKLKYEREKEDLRQLRKIVDEKLTVFELNESLTHYRELEYGYDDDNNIIVIKSSKWKRG